MRVEDLFVVAHHISQAPGVGVCPSFGSGQRRPTVHNIGAVQVTVTGWDAGRESQVAGHLPKGE